MTSERETQRAQQQAQREELVHAHTLEVDELNVEAERAREEHAAEMTALQCERDDNASATTRC